MALDKAIKFRKEHRKPYRGSKAIDGSCRNHGSCPWCERNRKHKFRDKHPPEKGADVFLITLRNTGMIFKEKAGLKWWE